MNHNSTFAYILELGRVQTRGQLCHLAQIRRGSPEDDEGSVGTDFKIGQGIKGHFRGGHEVSQVIHIFGFLHRFWSEDL